MRAHSPAHNKPNPRCLQLSLLCILTATASVVAGEETSTPFAAGAGDIVELEASGEEDTSTAAAATPVPNNPAVDQRWLIDALRDVAYYLRQHKFNEFDRRFFESDKDAPKGFYGSFPMPPLKILHWEVQRYCEFDFEDCVKYIQEKATSADLRRELDTLSVMRAKNWTLEDNSEQVEGADAECRRLRSKDLLSSQPFEDHLERFQWRASASYYMCWYTMRGRPELATLGEPCDNWASCLDPDAAQDPRAKDTTPFACALYSFCPDPCCPLLKHASTLEECWSASAGNPCTEEAPEESPQCQLNRELNTDFNALVLNRLNVTCQCARTGFVWYSRFGICVDIDECADGTHNCTKHKESCINLPGSFQCVCAWGYFYNSSAKECVPSKNFIIEMSEGDTSDLQALLEVLKPKIIVNTTADIKPEEEEDMSYYPDDSCHLTCEWLPLGNILLLCLSQLL